MFTTEAESHVISLFLAQRRFQIASIIAAVDLTLYQDYSPHILISTIKATVFIDHMVYAVYVDW